MSAQSEHEKHPTVTEHPEQRRQEETGREDAGEVGRPPSSSESPFPSKKKDAA
jgi:hypothetical protein